MRIILAALAAILVTLPAAAEDFRTIKSKYSVKDTIDRLSETLELLSAARVCAARA